MNRTAALATIALFAALVGLALWSAGARLRLDTSAKDLISADLPYRQEHERFEESFPFARAPLLVAVKAASPERAGWAADQLAQRLRSRERLFADARQAQGGEFFDRHALLHLSVDELERLADQLAAAQIFLGRLTMDPSARGLATLLTAALQLGNDAQVSALASVLERMRRAIPAHDLASGAPVLEMSWRPIMFGGGSEEAPAPAVIRVWLAKSADGAHASRSEAIAAIREAARTLELERRGASMRITGSAAMEREELATALRGMLVVGPLSALLVAGLLLYAMRSHALVIASLTTLAVGLALTLGFAALAVGRLNLISIAFGVLYVGLGADFAIHLGLTIRAQRGEGLAPAAALRAATRDVAGSLALCALTTMVGFLAFMPTSFVAVAELGLIAGAGMVINLVATLALFPALMAVLPSRWRQPAAGVASPALLRLLHAPERHRALVLALAGGAALAGLALAPNVRFDSDPLHLRDPESEAVRTLRELRRQHPSARWSVSAVAPDAESAADLSARLEQAPLAGSAVWAGSLVPTHQEQKLAILQELALVLGPTLSPPAQLPPPPATAQTLQSLDALRDQLEKTAATPANDPALASAAKGLADALRTWRLGAERDAATATRRLEQAWLGAFPIMMERLRKALEPPGPIALATLPAWLRQQWISPQGLHRVDAIARAEVSSGRELREFIAQTKRVAGRVVGPPVAQLESGRAVVRAFIEALSLATILILLIILLAFRSVATALEVLTPLAVGGLATLGAMALLNEPFNFANVIALPLLFGVGVDSGIHLVRRAKRRNEDRLLESATARGVWYSGLTTIAGFGSLAFSSHRGMASMGLVLSVGMVSILVSTLVVLPALLALRAPPSPGLSAQATPPRP